MNIRFDLNTGCDNFTDLTWIFRFLFSIETLLSIHVVYVLIERHA
jgi:hypothetical protein